MRWQRILGSFEKHNDGAPCDASCYRCLREYGNMPYHPLLDWRLGSNVARLCLGDGFDASSSDEEGFRMAEEFARSFVDLQATWIAGMPAVLSEDGSQAFIVAHPLERHSDDHQSERVASAVIELEDDYNFVLRRQGEPQPVKPLTIRRASTSCAGRATSKRCSEPWRDDFGDRSLGAYGPRQWRHCGVAPFRSRCVNAEGRTPASVHLLVSGWPAIALWSGWFATSSWLLSTTLTVGSLSSWDRAITEQADEASRSSGGHAWGPAGPLAVVTDANALAEPGADPGRRDSSRRSAPVLAEQTLTSPDGRLQGRPDVIIREPGDHRVVDVKTGRHPLAPSDYETQLRLYCHLEQTTSGALPKRAIVLPLRGAALDVICDQESVDAERQLALDLRAQFDDSTNDVEPLARPSDEACGRSAQALRCPVFWRVAAPDWLEPTAIEAHLGRRAGHGNTGTDRRRSGSGHAAGWIMDHPTRRRHGAPSARPPRGGTAPTDPATARPRS